MTSPVDGALTVTVSVPVAGVPESESVALTQYVVVELGDTVVLDRGVPVHELPEYQVYANPVPEPPDAVALRAAEWPTSIVAEEGITEIAGLTVTVSPAEHAETGVEAESVTS